MYKLYVQSIFEVFSLMINFLDQFFFYLVCWIGLGLGLGSVVPPLGSKTVLSTFRVSLVVVDRWVLGNLPELIV